MRNVCHHYPIFAPTFPLERMSVHEMERASTAPARMLSRFERKLPTSAVLPVRQRTLPLHTPERVELAYLAAGGRFLTVHTAYSLQLWDLGYPSREHDEEPRLVASTDTEGKLDQALAVECGDKIVVWTGTISSVT